jgi:hypothetical protein
VGADVLMLALHVSQRAQSFLMLALLKNAEDAAGSLALTGWEV